MSKGKQTTLSKLELIQFAQARAAKIEASIEQLNRELETLGVPTVHLLGTDIVKEYLEMRLGVAQRVAKRMCGE